MRQATKENWFDLRRENRTTKTGKLYEYLFAQTLGCEIAEHGKPEFADMFNFDLGFRVELKSRGELNSFEIRVNQVSEYEESIPFPLTHTLYAIVPYHNTRRLTLGGKRPSGFSKKTSMVSLTRGLKTDQERNRFWAENIQTSYLVDLRIISAMRTKLQTHSCRMIGRGHEQAIRLGRTALAEFFGDDSSFASTLRTLGLNASGWAKGVYPLHVRFPIDEQRLSSRFTLVTVLRKGLHAKVAMRLADIPALV